jgi:RNA polymerase sigma-70 factor (ECF subfamily)
VEEVGGGAGLVTPEERNQLLRLCTYLSGNADAAEDLVQETLLEAWRHEQRLRDPERRRAWLTGIARNVCKRWHRSRERVRDRLDTLTEADLPADDGDIEVQLEQDELAQLLDRALGLLPPDTRTILIARFIEELPHAEIAQRLRLTEGTVKVKVHRGKLALRKLLTSQFSPELEGYGVPGEDDVWQETQIWCMGCGSHRLRMRLSQERSTVSFRCPHCDRDPQVTSNFPLSAPQFASITPGVSRPGAIFRRGQDWSRVYFRDARQSGTLPCVICGGRMRVDVIAPGEDGLPPVLTDRLQAVCSVCDAGVSVSRTGLVTVLPEVRELRRRESRVRILPARHLEAEGRPAVVTSVGSVGGPARIDVVTDADTYRVITVGRGGLPEQL